MDPGSVVLIGLGLGYLVKGRSEVTTRSALSAGDSPQVSAANPTGTSQQLPTKQQIPPKQQQQLDISAIDVTSIVGAAGATLGKLGFDQLAADAAGAGIGAVIAGGLQNLMDRDQDALLTDKYIAPAIGAVGGIVAAEMGVGALIAAGSIYAAAAILGPISCIAFMVIGIVESIESYVRGEEDKGIEERAMELCRQRLYRDAFYLVYKYDKDNKRNARIQFVAFNDPSMPANNIPKDILDTYRRD